MSDSEVEISGGSGKITVDLNVSLDNTTINAIRKIGNALD